MFCPNCGAPNPDTASQCGSCGTFMNTTAPTPGPAAHASPYGLGPSGQVNTHLSLAITSLVLSLFCCSLLNVFALPLSIVAIVHSSQVNPLLAANDFAGAQAKARSAKVLSLVSLALTLGMLLLAFALGFFGELLAA